jgi:16S rRNA G966 N2-methylase RsmD
MFSGIDVKTCRFLDIGSGKGGAIIYSHQLGCAYSAGVEYEKFLHDIAVKNIERLHLTKNCTSYNMDARNFKRYAEFDIFFMFNPFDDDIYEQVVNAIKSQILQDNTLKPRYLICYGGANIDAVNRCSIFSLVREGNCPHRGNLFRVFKNNNYA